MNGPALAVLILPGGAKLLTTSEKMLAFTVGFDVPPVQKSVPPAESTAE
ncbi:hypothetical protein FTUN_0362 [Frigoriglobus tundricola]|uniref:Uncharacterized protein n=1 Tax=Frigoriglobus tundricola TaxID=2774151 RepID=A0A6M5YFT5_9BACT|nr:hypothetical protein FTUN_0362 [Frigoriglobus tundricola]